MFEYTTTIGINNPEGYSYTVFAGTETISITYDELSVTRTIYFGSLEEMEAVAKSMLRLVESIKQLKD